MSNLIFYFKKRFGLKKKSLNLRGVLDLCIYETQIFHKFRLTDGVEHLQDGCMGRHRCPC